MKEDKITNHQVRWITIYMNSETTHGYYVTDSYAETIIDRFEQGQQLDLIYGEEEKYIKGSSIETIHLGKPVNLEGLLSEQVLEYGISPDRILS